MSSVQTTITQLPQAGAITGTEAVPIVQNGVTKQTTTAAIAASPSQTQTFLTINQESTLPNSRYLSTGTGLSLADGGAQSYYRITLNGASGSLESVGDGIVVKNSGNSVINRSIAVTGNGLAITDGNGIAGNPTIALSGLSASLAGMSGSGMVAVLNGTTVTPRSITGTTNQVSVADGNGLAGNPTIAIASNPVLPGDAGAVMPSGGTALRPSAPTNGTLRYNSDAGVFEGYANNAWGSITTGGGVTSIATGTGLTGGPITSTGTISIADTAVTAGSYGSATQVGTFTVNAQGQLTAAGNTTVTPAWGSITGTPTTLAGYGITDGVSLTGTETLTNKTISGANNTLTNIGNSSLTNSSLTIGTTNIALGATSLTLGGLTSVAVTQDPTTALQLATKQYVDGLVSTGLTYHAPVQAATTASLASITGGTVTYNNGSSGVGATITLSVALTVLDGYTLLDTNRVLIKDEVNQAYNGVYTWATGGTVLTRATDADTYGTGVNQLSQNDYFFVQGGTVNKGTSYVVTTVGTITFGTTAITFAEFSSSQVYTGTSPIQVSGTVISLNTVPTNLGGTNLTSFTANGILYASSTSALATGSALTFDGTSLSTTGQFVSTATGSPTAGLGQLSLNGATSNRIDWNTNGTGAPTFTTRSAGTKALLYPAISGSQVDYAVGISAATLWSSVPVNSSSFYFKWYGGETEVASLDGTGAFTAIGGISGGAF